MSRGRPLFVDNEENQEDISQDRDPEYAAEVPTTRLHSSERKCILMFRIAVKCHNYSQTCYANRNWWVASSQVGAMRFSTTFDKYAWFVNILMTPNTLLNTSRTINLKGYLIIRIQMFRNMTNWGHWSLAVQYATTFIHIRILPKHLIS